MNKTLTILFLLFNFLGQSQDIQLLKHVSLEEGGFDCFLGEDIYGGKIVFEYQNSESSICRVYHDSIHYYEVTKPNKFINSLIKDIIYMDSLLDVNKGIEGCTGTDYYSFNIGNKKTEYSDEACIFNNEFPILCRKIQDNNYSTNKSSKEIKIDTFNLSGYIFPKEKPLNFTFTEKISTRFTPNKKEVKEVEKLLKMNLDFKEYSEFERQYIGWINSNNEKNVFINMYNYIWIIWARPMGSKEILVDCGALYSDSKQYNINLSKQSMNEIKIKIKNCR